MLVSGGQPVARDPRLDFRLMPISEALSRVYAICHLMNLFGARYWYYLGLFPQSHIARTKESPRDEVFSGPSPLFLYKHN